MSEAASKDLRGTIYDLIGYDQATKKVNNYYIPQFNALSSVANH